VLTPEIVVSLIGLAVLALLPVVYRKLGARRAAALRPSARWHQPRGVFGPLHQAGSRSD